MVVQLVLYVARGYILDDTISLRSSLCQHLLIAYSPSNVVTPQRRETTRANHAAVKPTIHYFQEYPRFGL